MRDRFCQSSRLCPWLRVSSNYGYPPNLPRIMSKPINDIDMRYILIFCNREIFSQLTSDTSMNAMWANNTPNLLDIFHGASLRASSRSRWNFILVHFSQCQVSEWCASLWDNCTVAFFSLYFTSHLAPDALIMFPPAPLEMFFFQLAWFSPQTLLTKNVVNFKKNVPNN